MSLMSLLSLMSLKSLMSSMSLMFLKSLKSLKFLKSFFCVCNVCNEFIQHLLKVRDFEMRYLRLSKKLIVVLICAGFVLCCAPDLFYCHSYLKRYTIIFKKIIAPPHFLNWKNQIMPTCATSLWPCAINFFF